VGGALPSACCMGVMRRRGVGVNEVMHGDGSALVCDQGRACLRVTVCMGGQLVVVMAWACQSCEWDQWGWLLVRVGLCALRGGGGMRVRADGVQRVHAAEW
jgi:hypothetical protein